jgi:hypothetical protein
LIARRAGIIANVIQCATPAEAALEQWFSLGLQTIEEKGDWLTALQFAFMFGKTPRGL